MDKKDQIAKNNRALDEKRWKRESECKDTYEVAYGWVNP